MFQPRQDLLVSGSVRVRFLRQEIPRLLGCWFRVGQKSFFPPPGNALPLNVAILLKILTTFYVSGEW